MISNQTQYHQNLHKKQANKQNMHTSLQTDSLVREKVHNVHSKHRWTNVLQNKNC